MKLSYKEKYKRIKKFVNFKFDLRFSEFHFEQKLSRNDKKLISYYFNILFGDHVDNDQGAVNYDVYMYRPRKKENKRKAARFAQITGRYKELKAIPIPRADKNKKLQLKFTDKKLIVKEKEIVRDASYFNMKNLAKNPEKEVKRAFNNLDYKEKIVIMAGHREILNESDDGLENLTSRVKTKMQRYSNYGEWMKGLIGYSFEEQADYKDYIQERKKSKRKTCKKCKKILKKKDFDNKKCQRCKTKI